MPIQQLPDHLINQIAAGEVIDRPSSIVKELLENSIDAGATRIDIELENGGVRLIKIRDNGSGIVADEMPLALNRHATSKISSLEDLTEVRTMGFRGEALSSIAAVSRMTLTSKHEGAEHGLELHYDCTTGNTTSKPASHQRGTTVKVADLFFNVPARRKFLRTDKTELNHIESAVKRIAMGAWHVGFTLMHNQKQLLRWPAIEDIDGNRIEQLERAGTERLRGVLGSEFMQNSLYFYRESDDLCLHGWLAQPTFSRSQADMQYFYVNQRMIRDKTISHAIKHAYSDLMYHARQPAYVVYLEMNPREVDVNVHPGKLEVRFRDSRRLHGFVSASVKEALASAGAGSYATAAAHALAGIDSASLNSAGKSDGKTAESSAASLLSAPPSAIGGKAGYTQFQHQSNMMLPVKEHGEIYRDLVAGKQPLSADDSVADIAETEIPPLGFALAHLHGAFILSQNSEGLVVVDAHAAHERITYERLKEQFEQGTVRSQPLLLPLTVHVSEQEAVLAEKHAQTLTSIGMQVDNRGPAQLLIRTVPVELQSADAEQLLRDVLSDLSEYGSSDRVREEINKLLSSMASEHEAA